MNIFLADTLDTLEFESISDFVHHYFTWAFWEKQLPVIGTFVGRVILAIVVYIIASKLIQKLTRFIVASMKRAGVDTGVTQFVSSVVKAALYCLLVVSIATSFGVKESSIAALVASGGVAIGLALQGGLSNLAGGVIILALKPFVVGDYVIAGGVEGSVQEIGLVYTKINTVDNKRISIPNSEISAAKIINCSTEGRRRMDLTFCASYDAPVEKVKSALLEAIQVQEKALMDPPPFVRLSAYKDSSIEYTIRVWCENADYWDLHFDILEKVKELFDRDIVSAQALNFIRGRSVTKTYLIIDEAQNLTPKQAKGIITRAGIGTKIILLGDPNQIDNPLLDERTNGLSYASEHMKGSPLCFQVSLTAEECERSALATDAVRRL